MKGRAVVIPALQALVREAQRTEAHSGSSACLATGHAERGITLQQFEVVESFLNSVFDVFELNVLVQIEEVFPFG